MGQGMLVEDPEMSQLEGGWLREGDTFVYKVADGRWVYFQFGLDLPN